MQLPGYKEKYRLEVAERYKNMAKKESPNDARVKFLEEEKLDKVIQEFKYYQVMRTLQSKKPKKSIIIKKQRR